MLRVRFLTLAAVAITGMAFTPVHIVSANSRAIEEHAAFDVDECVTTASAEGDCCTTPKGGKLGYHDWIIVDWCSGACGGKEVE